VAEESDISVTLRMASGITNRDSRCTLQDRNPLFREGERRYVMALLMLIEILARTGLDVKWSWHFDGVIFLV
jgi:hypothetical protein